MIIVLSCGRRYLRFFKKSLLVINLLLFMLVPIYSYLNAPKWRCLVQQERAFNIKRRPAIRLNLKEAREVSLLIILCAGLPDGNGFF